MVSTAQMALSNLHNRRNSRVNMGGIYKTKKVSKNNMLVVPLAGIEPALLSESDFESDASTNFTTGARDAP